jgi:hypothetical protein
MLSVTVTELAVTEPDALQTFKIMVMGLASE